MQLDVESGVHKERDIAATVLRQLRQHERVLHGEDVSEGLDNIAHVIKSGVKLLVERRADIVQ